MSATVASDAGRRWQGLWVRLAVALAFADASIVVLALPQIVTRLHTSISHVTWVIMAYNLALIVGSVAVLPLAHRLPSKPVLIGGLVLFGLASIGCGAANRLSVLVPLRAAEGIGGALVLCASLPLFAGASRQDTSALFGWSAAAAIGAAVGPAAGGVLTQIFDWRSIFFAQAPVAAFAAVAVLAVHARAANEPASEAPASRSSVDPLSANVALTFLSAGLIGALFLVVIELINVWQLTPLAAAAIVSTIPLATAVADRVARGRSPLLLGASGGLLLSVGLVVLAAISHKEIGLVILALAICGAGLGLGFPGLTAAALRSPGSATARAARTVAARDAGILFGLLILTPVFVNQLNAAPGQATPTIAAAVGGAPLPLNTKVQLGQALIAANNSASQSELPDIHPAFASVAAGASPSERAQLAVLERRLSQIIQDAATHAFKRPLLFAAAFALFVVPLLGFRLYLSRLAPVSARTQSGGRAARRSPRRSGR